MSGKNQRLINYKKKEVLWSQDPNICKSCGLCIIKCPVKSLSFDLQENEYLGLPAIKNNITLCIACGTCEQVCPDCAIKVTKLK